MTLPSSGTITWTMIKNEYGLSNGFALSELYGKPGIPSSGQLKMSDFYGKSAATMSISPPDQNSNAATGSWTSPSSFVASVSTSVSSYSWTLVSTTGTGTWTIQSPSSSSTKVAVNGVIEVNTATATFRCTANLSGGGSISATCTASFRNTTPPF